MPTGTVPMMGSPISSYAVKLHAGWIYTVGVTMIFVSVQSLGVVQLPPITVQLTVLFPAGKAHNQSQV